MRRSKGYDLPGCIILTAAVYGTKKAYDAAMAMLPMARRLEGRAETVAEGSRFAKDEYRAPASAISYGLLDWARARVKRGVGLPGLAKTAKQPRVGFARGKHGRHGEMKGLILQELAAGPRSIREMARALQVSPTALHYHLKALATERRANDDLVGPKPEHQVGPAPRLWRLT
jgi:DNA-binding transcriptional ArsR family regulator